MHGLFPATKLYYVSTIINNVSRGKNFAFNTYKIGIHYNIIYILFKEKYFPLIEFNLKTLFAN